MVITLTIPDAVATRVIDALCLRGGYSVAVLQNGVLVPNPLTRAQFARQTLVEFIKDSVKALEGETALRNAKAVADTKVDNEVVIT